VINDVLTRNLAVLRFKHLYLATDIHCRSYAFTVLYYTRL